MVITGYNKPYFCDRSILEADEHHLVAGCIRDIVEGIDGTDVKAGIVKGGSGYKHVSGVRSEAAAYCSGGFMLRRRRR